MKEVKKGNIIQEVEIVVKDENISHKKLVKLITDARFVIPKNVKRNT